MEKSFVVIYDLNTGTSEVQEYADRADAFDDYNRTAQRIINKSNLQVFLIGAKDRADLEKSFQSILHDAESRYSSCSDKIEFESSNPKLTDDQIAEIIEHRERMEKSHLDLVEHFKKTLGNDIKIQHWIKFPGKR